MPFTLSAPRSEVEHSQPQGVQRTTNIDTYTTTINTTNHYPRRQRSACSTLTHTIKTNSMVRYCTLIFLIGLISVLYFAITHQVLKPTGVGPIITSDLFNVTTDNFPRKSPDDGFPIGNTKRFDTYEASGKGNVQQIVEGNLRNNTNQAIKGVLYDRGDGCQNIKFNTNENPPAGIVPSMELPDEFSDKKVSLITSNTTNCSLDAKISKAIEDKDKAIIFMQSNSDDLSGLKQDSYDIAIFTIDRLTGDMLLIKLNSLYNDYLVNPQGKFYILTVTLTPFRQLIVSSWLFAMFAVGGILVASFFVSILIHMRLYRLRRNQQDEVRRQRAADEVLGMKKWTLEKEDIDTFPIIIYVKKSVTTSEVSTTPTSDNVNDNDDSVTQNENENNESTSTNQQLHRSTSTRSTKSTRSINAINNATNLYNSPTAPTTPTTPTTPIPITSATTTAVGDMSTTEDGDADTCAICIEDFAEGERLRLLPCKHWYHVECIDPWLTTKSSSCPLCKTDCRPNQIDEIIIDSPVNSLNQDSNNESGRNNNDTNVVIRMGRAVGKLFGNKGRSISVRPADTQPPPNDSTVVELEMENPDSSRSQGE